MESRTYAKDTNITLSVKYFDGLLVEDSDTGDSGVYRIRGWADSYRHYWKTVESMVVTISAPGAPTLIHTWTSKDRAWNTASF